MKNIGIYVTDDFHKKVKMFATEQGKTLKDVVIQALEKELEKEKRVD